LAFFFLRLLLVYLCCTRVQYVSPRTYHISEITINQHIKLHSQIGIHNTEPPHKPAQMHKLNKPIPHTQQSTQQMSEAYQKEITNRLTKTFLDIQLLRLVATEPMWGYKIKKTVETSFGVKLRHGALYPMLNYLEKEGFLTCQKQQQNGRARKVYTTTAKGKEYLEAYYSLLKEQIQTKTEPKAEASSTEKRKRKKPA
jgi:PadR family transcriptional regulator, regulatory protein PadR